jgi:hypothetical protein
MLKRFTSFDTLLSMATASLSPLSIRTFQRALGFTFLRNLCEFPGISSTCTYVPMCISVKGKSYGLITRSFALFGFWNSGLL